MAALRLVDEVAGRRNDFIASVRGSIPTPRPGHDQKSWEAALQAAGIYAKMCAARHTSASA